MDGTKWTAIGKIFKAHGIKGEVRLQLDFTFLFPEALPEILYLESNGSEPIPFFISSWDVLDDQHAIIGFDEITDRSSAEQLKGKSVFLHVTDAEAFEVISEKSVFSDIEGFKVYNKKQNFIGTIKELQWFPAHPVGILEENPDWIIPLHDDFLVSKDIEKKVITIDLPEGLFEQNSQ